MSTSLRALVPLFLRERAEGHSLVLATVVHTDGPTYTKAGALMLMAENGVYAGLLSGGCLEGDLAEHGRAVLKDGQAKLVRYDMHGPDELLFGLGSGCEGAMDILLQRLDAAGNWQPMTRLAAAWQARNQEGLLLVVRSEERGLPPGCGVFISDSTSFGHEGASALLPLLQDSHLRRASRFMPRALSGVDVLELVELPAPRILLLGAGPDAKPLADLVSFMGWNLVVIDHRPHYAQHSRFPDAERVLEGGPAALRALLRDEAPRLFSAAIVMSHHFLSDRNYLVALADSDIAYVGLLGPAVRRERLLSQLGTQATRLRSRLHSPVGLDLGADSPEAIALAIAAEIQSVLGQREPTARVSSKPTSPVSNLPTVSLPDPVTR